MDEIKKKLWELVERAGDCGDFESAGLLIDRLIEIEES